MKKILIVLFSLMIAAGAAAQSKKFATDSLRVNKLLSIGLPASALTSLTGEYAASLGFVTFSDTTNPSIFSASPIGGSWWLWSYKIDSGTDLPINIVIGVDAVAHFSAANNFGVGGQSTFGTNAENVIGIPNGTAPTTSPANIVQLYAEDVSGSSELKVRDEAGNVMVLSDLTARRCIAFDATALYPHATNGPDLSVFNGQVELYEFAVGDTGYARASLVNYSSIDSIWVEAQSTSPAGDSAEATVYWRGVQSGDVETAAFAGSATAEMDMGSTANGIIRFRFTSSLNTGLTANDDVTWAVVRTAATANEMAETLNIRRMLVWYH